MTTVTNPVAPKGIKARRGGTAAKLSASALRASINPHGNTVLRDFARVIRDEPHKYIYSLKLYAVRDNLASKPVLDWLRDRYISAKNKRNHGARYEVRTYKGADGKRYVDYMLLEQMTEEERVMFTLQFGDVTDKKVVRDGKLRRPRLKKEEKKILDKMIDDYYLKVAEERRLEAEANLAASSNQD